MLEIIRCHHVAIICTDRRAALDFYQGILGLRLIREEYRRERDSWKIDLQVPGADGMQIELFTFPQPPPRPTQPEAAGLRHLAFGVVDIEAAVQALRVQGVPTEDIRVDAATGRRYVFCRDPDDLPVELYCLTS